MFINYQKVVDKNLHTKSELHGFVHQRKATKPKVETQIQHKYQFF